MTIEEMKKYLDTGNSMYMQNAKISIAYREFGKLLKVAEAAKEVIKYYNLIDLHGLPSQDDVDLYIWASKVEEAIKELEAG